MHEAPSTPSQLGSTPWKSRETGNRDVPLECKDQAAASESKEAVRQAPVARRRYFAHPDEVIFCSQRCFKKVADFSVEK